LIVLPGSHEAQSPLPLVQLAGTGADIALHPAVLDSMPVARQPRAAVRRRRQLRRGLVHLFQRVCGHALRSDPFLPRLTLETVRVGHGAGKSCDPRAPYNPTVPEHRDEGNKLAHVQTQS